MFQNFEAVEIHYFELKGTCWGGYVENKNYPKDLVEF